MNNILQLLFQFSGRSCVYFCHLYQKSAIHWLTKISYTSLQILPPFASFRQHDCHNSTAEVVCNECAGALESFFCGLDAEGPVGSYSTTVSGIVICFMLRLVVTLAHVSCFIFSGNTACTNSAAKIFERNSYFEGLHLKRKNMLRNDMLKELQAEHTKQSVIFWNLDQQYFGLLGTS